MRTLVRRTFIVLGKTSMATSVESLDDRIGRLAREKEIAWENFKKADGTEASAQWKQYKSISAAYQEALHEMSAEALRVFNDIRQQHEQERILAEEQATRYDRPANGLVGWMSRWLGPLPANAKKVDLSSQALAALPSYRLMGFILMCLAVALIVSLAFLAPWLVISPAELMYRPYVSLLGPSLGLVATALSSIWLMVILSNGYRFPRYGNGGFIDQAAASEEQWFRMGAESWTIRQRVASCITFGFMHIINVIYPITSLLVISLLGAVLMAVYLREYKRSGDVERAVQVTTKLHAAYNRFAFVYTGTLILIVVLSSFYF